MRVLFVASEAYPLVKTGGLADVAGALPAALARAGVDVQVVLPGYPAVLDGVEAKGDGPRLTDRWGDETVHLRHGRLPDGLPVAIVDAPGRFRRDGGPYLDSRGHDWGDNHRRFALFSRVAALLAVQGDPQIWRPDIVHAHDWQTGLVPAYMNAGTGINAGGGGLLGRPGTVFTIHNIAYQGLFGGQHFPELGLPAPFYGADGLEYYGQISFLKAGLVFADRLTTVSPTYAWEIQQRPGGCGLEGVLAERAGDLHGLVNGVDYAVWDPRADRHLVECYTAADVVAGKAANKTALQRELGLRQDAEAPLAVVVSRLADHKGLDLIPPLLPELLARGIQVAVAGSGDKLLERTYLHAAHRHPGQVAVHIGYDEALAHRLQAGGDLLLMPSRSEPCGLTQLYALRYGTVPVVHRAGGLADTVVDATPETLSRGTASGFAFSSDTGEALLAAVDRALALYRDPGQWHQLIARIMTIDFGWDRAAEGYLDLYRTLLDSQRRQPQGSAPT